MANREQRKNREKKKPKQDKNAKTTASPGFGAQMNQAKAPPPGSQQSNKK